MTTPASTSSQYKIPCFFQMVLFRLSESKLTCTFTILVLTQCIGLIFCTIIPFFDNYTGDSFGYNNFQSQDISNEYRLLRLVFFVAFVIMSAAFALDGVVRNNFIQLLAYNCVQLLTVAGPTWWNVCPSVTYKWDILAFNAACILLNNFFVWGFVHQFGWNIYNHLGPDIKIRRIYYRYQEFIVLFKTFTLFNLAVNAFLSKWLVTAFSSRPIIALSTILPLYHCVIMALSFATFFIIGSAARRENWTPLLVYLFLLICFTVDLAFIFSLQLFNFWGNFFMAVGAVLLAFNIVYTIIVIRNFNKGLKERIRALGKEESSVKTWWSIEPMESGISLSSPPTSMQEV